MSRSSSAEGLASHRKKKRAQAVPQPSKKIMLRASLHVFRHCEVSSSLPAFGGTGRAGAYAVIEAAAVHWDRLGTLELLGLLEKEAVVARPQSIQAWNRASPSPERQSWRQRRIRQKLHLSLKEEGFQSQRESSLHADAVAADGSSLVT